MPRFPRRGSLNRRYAENVVKQSLPRRETHCYPRQLEEFETQPPQRHVPHYEDDPYWTCNRDEESSREGQGNSDYQSYGENHRGKPFNQNPRNSWFSRRNKPSAPQGRGKKVKKAEPPLLMCGFPRLDRSFVMAKSSDSVQKEGESSLSNTASSDNVKPDVDIGRSRLSSHHIENTSPCQSSNYSEVPSRPKHCELPQGPAPAINSSPTEKESVSTNADSSQVKEKSELCVNPDPDNMQDSLSGQQDGCESGNNIAEQTVGNDDSIPESNYSQVLPPEVPMIQDQVELEKETKKYYEELLGVEKPKDEKAPSEGAATEEPSISASQVANITKKYDSSEVEKAKEEARQEEIQTAWSILHQYWEFVRENPYDFNGWTYLLTHVENMDNLEAARSAFEGFLPLYPYCFAYWKKLSDMEVKHNEIERSLGVLMIGTHCIPLSTDLWMPLLDQYISYAKKKELPPHYVRELYEYGLQNIGGSWHGSCLWETSIDFELNEGNLVGVMVLYKRLLATPTKLYNKHWDHFLALVRDHHPRNLLSTEEYEALRKQTCEELKMKYTPARHMPSKSLKKTPQPEDKLTTHMKEKLVASYIKTHESNEEQVDKRWKFEERIKRPYFHVKPLDKKQIKNWKDYLDFEINEGNPLRIIPLFERCLVACALYEEFWCQYCTYMENHVQNIIDGKFKDYSNGESVAAGSNSESKDKEADKDKEDTNSVSDSQASEASTNKNVSHFSVSDGQVNSENIVDVTNVESKDSSEMRGSGTETSSNSVIMECSDENSAAQHSKNDDIANEQNQYVDNSETVKTSNKDSVSGESGGQSDVVKSEPPTIEQIKNELCASLSLDGRVLKCPPLTPKWIMTGVSWEDVRQIYRRGAWIHCPSKPSLLMQWAEFEEIQGNLDTARELLNTVMAKYPTSLKGRMQLIELERRAGCHSRVEELYGEASRALTLPRQRSWLAIKYARFLFKVLMEADRALAILRKALKKDRGYVHLYHHVFDICYQRQPLDCRGVLASVLLALTSKELPAEDKYWFAYKRVQFLREHGDIQALKAAIKEQDELREQAGLNLVTESKASSTKKSKEVKKEDQKKSENDKNEDDKEKKEEDTPVSTAAPTETPTMAPPDTTFTVPNSVPPPNQQFPVPYFSADGAITYSPMEGYGYGHADPSQNLPTAQEVVQGAAPASGKSNEEYHAVPPSWDLNVQIGSYLYGNSPEQQWQQRNNHQEYYKLVSKGYASHLKDHEVEDLNLPMPIKIDHLRPKHSPHDQSLLPDLTQPPPGHIGPPPNMDLAGNNRVLLPTPADSQASNRALLPTPPNPLCGQAGTKVLLPTPPGMPPNFTRPPPPLVGMGPPGLIPPGFGPPGSNFQGTPPPGEDHQHRPFHNDSQHLGKRQHPDNYRSEGERPYKMQNTNFDGFQQYRSEYDDRYTSSPGPSAPPSHRANFGSYDGDYDAYSHGRRENDHPNDHPNDQFSDECAGYNVENSRLNEPKRYSLRDESFDNSIPREPPRLDVENLSVNVPDWLMQDGGELCLSDTSNGVSAIRYWPNFMTSQGHADLFRVLRKRLKWYQRRALVDGQWQNLPHLLSWIGPCDYSYSGVTLEKNADWLPEIVDLLHRLIRYTGNQYNCCYLALHRNGYDHTSWMSENHLALRKNPSVASISIGATRVLEMRRKTGGSYLRFPLLPGSLLLMEGATQEDWNHQFPKQPNVPGERIHIIFRKFYMIEGLTI